ncbi:MAG: NAD(P)/FAD-dependent oxidoreductase [Pseudomonadota bacterium]
MTIAILGAGFSGLCMGARLRQCGHKNFKIYEKADEVGGTWRENTYPGVACDVPSHLYSFSFSANPNWSSRYSPGAEIFEYAKDVTRSFDLYPDIEFGRHVLALNHDGERWIIAFKDGTTVTAGVVVSGLGGLHVPNIPEFDGTASFTGPIFHTAEWRDGVDLAGKHVAVVGSAASAVQVVPEIADVVSQLDIYQRTPNWILPRRSYRYPKFVKRLFSTFPWLARAYRGIYFSINEARFSAFQLGDSLIRRIATSIFHNHLNASIDDEELRKALTPSYPIGCKRVLISDSYFEALNRKSVNVVTDGVAALTPTGVRTSSGEERAADVIILATGFRSFDILQSVDVTGPTGTKLRDAWSDRISAHRTIATPGFPNFFLLLGPNSGLGHNSVLLMIEAQVEYILKLLKQAENVGARLIEPRREAADRYAASLQGELAQRVWSADCGAWYVDENGHNFTLYPNSVRHFLRAMRTPSMAEYSMPPTPPS